MEIVNLKRVPFRDLTVIIGSCGVGIQELNNTLRMEMQGELAMIRCASLSNLHPKEQVETVARYVEMTKGIGRPIVLLTVSPFVLQAVRYYAAKEGVESNVQYLEAIADKSSNAVTLRVVSEDLNRVFKDMAEPLDAIMNVDAIREGVQL